MTTAKSIVGKTDQGPGLDDRLANNDRLQRRLWLDVTVMALRGLFRLASAS
jgi:hypothetical protein